MVDSTLAWLAFHLLFQGHPSAARRLLERFGTAAPVFRAGRDDLDGLRLRGQALEAVVSGQAIELAAGELEKIRRKAYTLLTFEDPDYPGYLREIFDPPFVLYCEGRTEALREPAVAVVGARKCTFYGRAVAEKLAADLAARGAVIVSGLALGIDASAHWGALRNGRTVAVLGSGLDVVYPAENRGLARKIAERGTVVTEFRLGTRPLPMNFPVRNRIISGLSLGVVVVEAARRSGSLISARFALDQGREVLAVPGNILSELSRGTNGLIRDGAKLVESWEDVAGEMPSPWREKLLAPSEEREENIQAPLSQEERRLMDALPADVPVHIDELAEGTGLPVSALLALLLGLELQGAVLQQPGKYFQRRT